jgi:hypothetical protein
MRTGRLRAKMHIESLDATFRSPYKNIFAAAVRGHYLAECTRGRAHAASVQVNRPAAQSARDDAAFDSKEKREQGISQLKERDDEGGIYLEMQTKHSYPMSLLDARI